MEWLALLLAGCLVYAQYQLLRNDVFTLLLIVAAEALLINPAEQLYFVTGAYGLVVSLLVATVLTAGVKLAGEELQ